MSVPPTFVNPIAFQTRPHHCSTSLLFDLTLRAWPERRGSALYSNAFSISAAKLTVPKVPVAPTRHTVRVKVIR